jgi:urease accessory protein
MTDLSLLKLLQLSSPTLPVGAFAYSQGLESAIENELVTNVESVQNWLIDCLCLSLKFVDLPIFSRLYQCWSKEDIEGVMHWNQMLVAQRETRELRDEDHHLGIALARLLTDLDIEQAKQFKSKDSMCFLTSFSLAACEWRIPEEQAANGFVWSWLDNQIAAAIKLVPLGQTDGQRVLSAILPKIPLIVSEGLALPEVEIGASLPMLAILSSQHETQYSRLFRS